MSYRGITLKPTWLENRSDAAFFLNDVEGHEDNCHTLAIPFLFDVVNLKSWIKTLDYSTIASKQNEKNCDWEYHLFSAST